MNKVNKGRIMALDIGTKRIGVALSDEKQLIAQPFVVITRKSETYVFETIKNIIAEYQVKKIIVGVPFSSHKKISKMAQNILQFIEKLHAVIDIPVVPWDESLTTFEAENILLEADISRQKRKKVIDKLAAALILESFLKAKNEKK